jgi:acetyl esterase/lipase
MSKYAWNDEQERAMNVTIFVVLNVRRIAVISFLVIAFSLVESMVAHADTNLWVVGRYGAVYSLSHAKALTQYNFGIAKDVNRIALGTDGYLYGVGVENGLNGMWRIKVSNGQLDTSWTVGNLGTNSQHGNTALRWGPDGKLYMTQVSTTYVTQVDPGSKSAVQLSLGGGSINNTTGGIAFDQTGSYAYVSQLMGSDYHVYKYSLATWTRVPEFDIVEPVNGGSQNLCALASGGDGYLYVSNYYRAADVGATIYRFDQVTGAWDSTWSAFTSAAGNVTRILNLEWRRSSGLAKIYATTNSRMIVSADTLRNGTSQVMTTCLTLPLPHAIMPEDTTYQKLSFPKDLEFIPHLEFCKAGEQTLRLNILRPKSKSVSPMPVVVYIHGGAWRSGSKDGYLPILIKLAQHGYCVVSIQYRLSQEAVFPASIQDCKCAVRWLRAHASQYNIDPKRIGAIGLSAGGHLVALLGTSAGVPALEGSGGYGNYSSSVGAVVDWAGPTDFLKVPESFAKQGLPTEYPDYYTEFLGGEVADKRALAVMASPVTFVSRNNPPFLILYADHDVTVPIQQDQLLLDALRKAGVEATAYTFKGEHGSKLDARGEALVLEFFDKHLKASP